MRLRTITDLLTESNVSARSSLTDDGRSQTVLYRGGGNGGPSLIITEQARGNLYDLAHYDGYSDEPFVVTGVTPLAAVMAAVDFHRTN